MKKLSIILLTLAIIFSIGYSQSNLKVPEHKIFVFGGDINQKFVQFVVDLTEKQNPKICYLPTASADNPDNIKYWDFICRQLSLEPNVLKVWVSSDKSNKSFEEILLSMDAIIVGGGNTLNMMGIWQAQGIDELLRKALNNGIILAGGSAGSICWFQNGISDSRPVSLSIVNGLAFLPYSNCPHYGDSLRRELYFQKIQSKGLNEGYASDDLSGILFINGEFSKAVSINDINHSYYVSLRNGAIDSKKLKAEILVKKDALPVTAYTSMQINKAVDEFPEINDQSSPLNAFIFLKYIQSKGQQSKLKQLASYYLQDRLSDTLSDVRIVEKSRKAILNTTLNNVLIYHDSVGGVINKMYDGFYGLWFFYKEDDKWMSAGEDIGGETVFESEITFREKAKMHLEKVRKLAIKH